VVPFFEALTSKPRMEARQRRYRFSCRPCADDAADLTESCRPDLSGSNRTNLNTIGIRSFSIGRLMSRNQTCSVAEASLRFHGYPRQVELPKSDLWYVYEDVSPTGPYAHHRKFHGVRGMYCYFEKR
jgi:hypothetical protein